MTCPGPIRHQGSGCGLGHIRVIYGRIWPYTAIYRVRTTREAYQDPYYQGGLPGPGTRRAMAVQYRYQGGHGRTVPVPGRPWPVPVPGGPWPVPVPGGPWPGPGTSPGGHGRVQGRLQEARMALYGSQEARMALYGSQEALTVVREASRRASRQRQGGS